LSRATYSNIAEKKLDWYEELLPWLMLTAQEYSYKLFTEPEQQRLFVEQIVETLLKGDITKRYEAYSMAIKDGWVDRDEVRRRENFNSMGPAGKIKTIQPGVTNIDTLLEKPGQEPPPKEPDYGPAMERALRVAFGRMIHKEILDVREAAKRPREWNGWLDGYYRHWLDKMETGMIPAVEVCRTLGVDLAKPVEEACFEHCRAARDELLELAGRVTPDQLEAAVEETTTRWDARLGDELTKRVTDV